MAIACLAWAKGLLRPVGVIIKGGFGWTAAYRHSDCESGKDQAYAQ